jgi:hypothetical protein
MNTCNGFVCCHNINNLLPSKAYAMISLYSVVFDQSANDLSENCRIPMGKTMSFIVCISRPIPTNQSLCSSLHMSYGIHFLKKIEKKPFFMENLMQIW